MPSGYLNGSAYPDLDSAVSAAISQGKSGVYIPPATTIPAMDTLHLPNSFGVVGEDPNTSMVVFSGMTDYRGFLPLETLPRDIRFENLTLDTSAIPPPPGTTANANGVIEMTNATGVVVRKVRFRDSPRFSVLLQGRNNIVEDCEFIDGHFIKVSIDGSDTCVCGNTINGGTWQGIRATGTNHHITGNTITRLTGGQSFGVFISGLSHSLIRDNRIEYNEHYGIFGQGASTHHNAITDNVVRGIGIVDGDILDEAGSGIVLWPGAHHNLVARNEVEDCRGYALLVAGNMPAGEDAEGNVLSSNTTSGSSDPGIVVSGASNTLVRKNSANGHFSTGYTIGFEVPDVHSTGSLVLHNTANGNMLEGFNLNATSDTYVLGNTATDNSTGTWPGHVSAGIALCVGQLDCRAMSGSGTTNNLLLGNVCTDHGGDQDYGVYLGAGVSSNTIRYNDLYPNAVAAFEDASGASNTINNNRTSSSTSVLDAAPPIADAGAGANLAIGQAATLDGSGSYFMGSAATMSYSWAQVYGPAVQLTNTDSPQAGFLAPTVTQLELLGFRLNVENANGSTYDEVYFAVVPAPVWTCGNGTLDAYEQCDDGNLDDGDGCDSNCTFTGCGNGIVTSGEGCDDGNLDDGDCCLSTCQPAPAGTPCDDDDPCTQEDGCSAGVCLGWSQPDPTCQAPSQPGKTSVVLRDRQPDTGDRLSWKWTHGPTATPEDFGDPVDGSTSYKLCIYDEGGPSGAPRLILSGWIPSGGSCAGRDCWRRAGASSFRYKDKTRSSDGMQTLVLKAHADGSAKIVAAGKGAGLAFAVPELGLAAPVTVQLQSTHGGCWEAIYRSPARNRSDFFRAKVVSES